jgi:hypothetical protein
VYEWLSTAFSTMSNQKETWQVLTFFRNNSILLGGIWT